MKQTLYLYIAFGVVLLLLLNSCTTSRIVFDVMDPADIEIPEGIENTVLINLITASGTEDIEDINELFKGRGELVNQIASQGTVTSLTKELQNVHEINLPQARLPEGLSNTAENPVDLPWEIIDSICMAMGKKTIIALTSFDSRTDIDYSGFERRTQESPAKVWTKTMAYDVSTDYVHIARLKTYVDIGWKIYYPAERLIVSDQVYPDSVFTEVEGNSLVEAEKNLPGIKNAIEDAGYIAGSHFASRISPGWTTVERIYYTSGNDDFKQAQNFVKMRYWTEAAEFWRNNIDNPDPNIASKARFNLTLIYEMNGQLKDAVNMLESARNYRSTILVDEYIQVLQQRMISPDTDSERY